MSKRKISYDTGPNDSLWFSVYWAHLKSEILDHPKRRIALAEILESENVLTAGALASSVERRLQKENPNYGQDLLGPNGTYDKNSLNRMLPLFESVGVVMRVPKFERDGQYALFVVDWVRDWLREQRLEERKPRTFPEGGAASVLYYLAQAYPVQLSGETDATPAALTLPIEAVIYAGVQQHAEVTDPRVELNLGSLIAIREAGVEALFDEVDLGIDLPGPDDPFEGKRRVHDYAIVGELYGISEEVQSESDLRHRLRVQLATLTAGVQDVYSQTYSDGSENVGVDAEATEEGATRLLTKDGLNAALKRCGLDAQVDNENARVVFGSYVRDKMKKNH